jgi:FkbM family methyltransferase
MNFDKLYDRLMPPVLAWRLGRAARERRELESFQTFYRNFVNPGDLCFDIGANLGNRTRCFRHLGCKVVAVEPQEQCFRKLQQHFGGDPDIHLLHKAVGREEGEAVLHLSSNHVLASLSTPFIERMKESGRFKSGWNGKETVEVTTMDRLIDEFGDPAFIKIDVEGFESEVLTGLTRPVRALSIEWTPEFPENTRACLLHLVELGDYEFNLSWGESMRFSRPQWRSLESMMAVIDEFEGETLLFGDVYARIKIEVGTGH